MKLNKYYCLCLMLPLFLCSFTDGTKKKTDWEKDGLKGKVKSVHIFTYNKADEKTLKINPSSLSKNDTANHLVINYDMDGNLTKWNMSNGKILLLSNLDTAMNMVISAKYSPDDKLIYEDTAILDNNGNRVEQMIKHYQPSVSYFRASYNVDDKGKVHEMDAFADGKYAYKWNYVYDEKGNRIEEDQYSSTDTLLQKYMSQYDETGNKTEMDLYVDTLFEKTVLKYDANGAVTEESHYSPDGKLLSDYTFKYIYDDKGNWIRKVTNDKQRQPPVTIRVIEYY